MKNIIKLEEFGQLALAIALFMQLDYSWWLFPALLLIPDLSMIGYLHNPRSGAILYNFFHHKLTAILVYLLGILINEQVLLLSGVILFGHSAMDRMFGYGLKYYDHFKNTHLGWIGGKAG